MILSTEKLRSIGNGIDHLLSRIDPGRANTVS